MFGEKFIASDHMKHGIFTVPINTHPDNNILSFSYTSKYVLPFSVIVNLLWSVEAKPSSITMVRYLASALVSKFALLTILVFLQGSSSRALNMLAKMSRLDRFCILSITPFH